MIENLQVPVPAGAAGEFSSPGQLSVLYFGIHSTPVLP